MVARYVIAGGFAALTYRNLFRLRQCPTLFPPASYKWQCPASMAGRLCGTTALGFDECESERIVVQIVWHDWTFADACGTLLGFLEVTYMVGKLTLNQYFVLLTAFETIIISFDFMMAD